MKLFLALSLLLALQPLLAARTLTLGEYSHEARRSIEGRIRQALAATRAEGEVTGTVTFAADGHFFIQVDDDGLKVVLDEVRVEDPPAVGDEVVISGIPTLEGGRVVFQARKWHRVGAGELPPPVAADSAALVYSGEGRSVNWRRVEVEGRAIGITQNGFAINVKGLPVNVVMDSPPDFIASCDRTHPMVRVCGVAELMLDQSALFTPNRYVLGVKVNAVGPDAVTLQPDFIYLTNLRSHKMTIFWTALIATLIVGIVVFAAVIYRQRRRLFRSRTIMAERKRMADDLHDTIEQHLVGAGMFLKLNRLKEAEEILLRAKREMRDIVWGLKNDEMLRQTPAEMIENYARDENSKGIYAVEAKLEGLPAHLEAGAMRDLSLVLREAIGNAVKHGGARHITISSDGNGEHWTLRIANDGKPFDPAQAPGPAEGHFGVEGMRQRARRFGATITFEQTKEGMVMEVTK